MVRHLAAVPVTVALALLLAGGAKVSADAQQAAPIPLYPQSEPPAPAASSVEPEPLPPVDTSPPLPQSAPPAGPAPEVGPPAEAAPASSGPSAAASERVFCGQSVSVQLADPVAVPEPYRPFLGMFSDGAWTPQVCAALVVEKISPDGRARIVYAFGPTGSNDPVAGGLLHGTGIIKEGELRFQNSDGTQFAFRPLYGDLDGRLTTPKGQTYRSMFKKSP